MIPTPFPRRLILAAGVASLLVPQISSADVLEHFTFGTEPPALLSPTTLAPGINATPIAAGAGVDLDLRSIEGNPPASSPWLRISPKAGNSNAAGAIAADARFYFTLSPLPGFTMDLTSLDFNVIKGGNSTRGYAVETSAGQHGAGIWTADVPTYRGQTVGGVLSPWTPVSIPLTDAAYQGLNSITFSIYSYSPNSGASVEYDDIVVNGEMNFSGYTWVGNTAAWDTVAANWSGAGSVYVDDTAGSHVLFDDNATVTNVTVAAGGVKPTNFYVANTAKQYSFSGGAVNTPGMLHKSGTGTLTLNNSVAAGSVVIATGSVTVENGGSLLSPSATVESGSSLTVEEGGALGAATGLNVNGSAFINDDHVTIGALNGATSGTLELGDIEDFETEVSLEVTGGGTFAGAITGPGSLVKSGTGVLVLNNAGNSFAGGLIIDGGAVQLSHANAAGLNGTTVNTGGTLVLAAAVASQITLDGGTLGAAAGVTLPVNTEVTIASDSTVATYNAGTDGTDRYDIVFLGGISGSGDLTIVSKNGNDPDTGGGFRLRGPDLAYDGTITVTKGTKFELRSNVETGSPMGEGTLVAQAGSFLVGEGGGTNLLGDYPNILVRNATTGNATFGNDVRIDEEGIALFNLVQEGGVTVAGSESRFGNLTIGDGQSIVAAATGSVQLALGFDTVTLTGGNATFVARPVGNTAYTASHTMNLGPISQGATEAGVTVNGVGTVVFTGTNTFTGPTIVQAGTLAVDGTNVTSDTIVDGGILGGTGTVGEVTLVSGTINPGRGIGSLDTGDLILDGGTLAFQIGGATTELYDQLNVTGTVSLNAQVNLTLDFATYDPVDFTDSFVLVSNNLTDAIAFASSTARLWYGGAQLDEGSVFIATSGTFTQAFEISYTGGSGNDIVLTAVPEPATAVTLMGGVALLAGMRRRRRS